MKTPLSQWSYSYHGEHGISPSDALVTSSDRVADTAFSFFEDEGEEKVAQYCVWLLFMLFCRVCHQTSDFFLFFFVMCVIRHQTFYVFCHVCHQTLDFLCFLFTCVIQLRTSCFCCCVCHQTSDCLCCLSCVSSGFRLFVLFVMSVIRFKTFCIVCHVCNQTSDILCCLMIMCGIRLQTFYIVCFVCFVS